MTKLTFLHSGLLPSIFYLRYDLLWIANENYKEFGVICGEQSGTSIIVTGDYAHLIFYSDSVIQMKGFLITFSAVPNSGKYK